jgi:hypothetical protein
MITCPICGFRRLDHIAKCPRLHRSFSEGLVEQKKIIGVQGVLELIKIKEGNDEKLAD